MFEEHLIVQDVGDITEAGIVVGQKTNRDVAYPDIRGYQEHEGQIKIDGWNDLDDAVQDRIRDRWEVIE